MTGQSFQSSGGKRTGSTKGMVGDGLAGWAVKPGVGVGVAEGRVGELGTGSAGEGKGVEVGVEVGAAVAVLDGLGVSGAVVTGLVGFATAGTAVSVVTGAAPAIPGRQALRNKTKIPRARPDSPPRPADRITARIPANRCLPSAPGMFVRSSRTAGLPRRMRQ